MKCERERERGERKRKKYGIEQWSKEKNCNGWKNSSKNFSLKLLLTMMTNKWIENFVNFFLYSVLHSGIRNKTRDFFFFLSSSLPHITFSRFTKKKKSFKVKERKVTWGKGKNSQATNVNAKKIWNESF